MCAAVPATSLLLSLLDSLLDPALVVDAAGRFVHVNPVFEHQTGLRRSDLVGQLADPLFELDERAEVARLHLRTGDRRFSARVTRTPDGQTLAVLREPAQERAAAASEFRELVEASPNPIVVVYEGRVIWANPAGAAAFGSPPGELLGALFSDLVSDIPENTPLGPNERRLRRLDGSTLTAEVRAEILPFLGNPSMVLFLRDLTHQRSLEVRLREMDHMVSIGTLAAGIAHEINTPIQYVGDSIHFVQGAVEDLLRLAQAQEAALPDAARAELAPLREELDPDYLAENVPAAMARAREGVERVSRIVRAMKDFGHPGGVEMAWADLDHAIQDTVTITRNEWKYVAQIHLDLGGLPLVHCHIAGLNQVLLNLLVNAAHAVGDAVRGTDRLGNIRISSRASDQWVHISVADDGVGIPEWARRRIFDPFFTTKEVGRGTGQGLAIARSIVVDRHHGRIRFDSEVGVGTTFHVDLPISEPPT